MCFSAQISFLSAGLLLSIGILTLLKVSRRSQIPFALLPLFFSIQQFAEGILWVLLAQNGTSPLITLATNTFLTLAFIIYPVWIPFSVGLMEADRTRRQGIALCGLIGTIWATAAAYNLITQNAITSISGCHIVYTLKNVWVSLEHALVLYAFATILPFFIARRWALKVFGGTLALSCALSYYLWYTYLTSIWCFFVALLSVGIYALIRNEQK